MRSPSSTLRNFLLLLLLILLFSLVLFPVRRERLQTLTGLEKPTFDVWLFYQPQDLLDALPAFNSQARWLYAISELTLDFAFPIIYTSWLRLALGWVGASLTLEDRRVEWLKRIPYTLFAADLLENTGIVLLLLTSPAWLSALAQITALASALKWLAGFACLGVVVWGAGLVAWKALAKKTGALPR